MQRLAKMLLVTIGLSAALLAGQNRAGSAPPPEDYSGMYSFVQEGEFVQITVEEANHVTGFVSRYGDQESDRGAFLDQFFKEARLDGKNLNFTTQTVHGTWFEFQGTVKRGDGKKPGDEAYFVLEGTLKQSIIDANQKTTSKSRDVVFKAFPKDLDAEPGK